MKKTGWLAMATMAAMAAMIQPACAAENATPASEIPAPPPPPEILAKAAEQLSAALQALNLDLAAAAQNMATLDPASPAARELLRQIPAKHPFVIDASFVSPAGIMTVVEPAAYQQVEGSDISQQAQVLKVHLTKEPVMSQSFLSVEGFPGVDIEYPVLQNAALKGSLSAFFRPDQFIGGIAAPLCQDSPVSLLAMQNDGISLYDSDPAQIGKNLFTDPLYQPFPELIQLGRSIAAQNTGTGRYSFFAPGTTNPVAKEAHWTTVSMYGTEWKLVSMKVLVP